MRFIIIAILTTIVLTAFQTYKNKKTTKSINSSNLLEVSSLLFPEYKSDFETFFNLFQNERQTFLDDNEDLLADYDNFDIEKLEPIEVLYIYGDSKGILNTTDWRGEENEGEIEKFLENYTKKKLDWKNTNELRKTTKEDARDGNFIIDLFKSIDNDLNPINKRLFFIDLGWDAYVFTVVDLDSFDRIKEINGSQFHGTEKLKMQ